MLSLMLERTGDWLGHISLLLPLEVCEPREHLEAQERMAGICDVDGDTEERPELRLHRELTLSTTLELPSTKQLSPRERRAACRPSAA